MHENKVLYGRWSLNADILHARTTVHQGIKAFRFEQPL